MGPVDFGNQPEAATISNPPTARTGIAALIRGPKDFWTGVIYVLFGGLAFWIARDYGFGTASRMGPGYFPTVLGVLLVLIRRDFAMVRSFIVPGEPLGDFAIQGRFPHHSGDRPVRFSDQSRRPDHCAARARAGERSSERKVPLRMEGDPRTDRAYRVLRARFSSRDLACRCR